MGKKNLQILNIFFGGGEIGQKSGVSDVLICLESFHFIKCKDVRFGPSSVGPSSVGPSLVGRGAEQRSAAVRF